MGGPVKEGIMDGIREPKADGGTIGGGTIIGQDVGKGRTGFFLPALAGIPAALTAARVAIPAALRAFGPAAVRGFKAARGFGATPGKLGFFGRAKDLATVRGGLSAPMAGSRAEGLGFRLGSFAKQNPFLIIPSIRIWVFVKIYYLFMYFPLDILFIPCTKQRKGCSTNDRND